MEATLKAGDVCLDCQLKGLKKFLRYFKINLNGDTLLKCESDECMYPYNDEICSSDDEEKSDDNLSQTNGSLKLINDLIQQFRNEEEVIVNEHINENVTEQVTHFDITFLDDLNEINNEHLCKPEIAIENNDNFVNDFNINCIENKYQQLTPNINSVEYEISPEIKKQSKNENNDNKPVNLNIAHDVIKNAYMAYETPDGHIEDSKRKLNIQSIETIKFEKPLNIDFPTSSKNYTMSIDIPSQRSVVPETNVLNPTETTGESLKYSSTKSKSKLKSQTSTLNPVNTTKAELFDIPKADILMKGNALLKKMKTMESNEKFPKMNTKCKKVGTKETSQNLNNKKQKCLDPAVDTDPEYSFHKITALLFAKNET